MNVLNAKKYKSSTWEKISKNIFTRSCNMTWIPGAPRTEEVTRSPVGMD